MLRSRGGLLQFEERPRHAGERIVREKKHRLLGGPAAVVLHVDANHDGIALRNAVSRHPKVRVDESPVRQTVPERVQRVVRRIEILAGEVILRIERTPGRSDSEEDRELPGRSRPTYRRTAARGHMTE